MSDSQINNETSVVSLGNDVIAMIKRIYRENGYRYTKLYIFSIICLLIIAVTTAFTAWIMRDVIDEIFYRRREDLIIYITMAIMGSFTIRAMAMYFQATTMARIGNDLVASYQSRVFSKLMDSGIGFFHSTRSGQLAAQIGQNIDGIRTVLSSTITGFARDFVTLIGLVAVMFTQDAVLSLITLFVGPVLFLGVTYVSKRVRPVVRETVELNARVIGTMQEAMQGVTIVKAFTMESQLKARLEKIIDHAKERSNKLTAISERVSPISEIIAGFAVAGAIAYGGFRAINLDQPPGGMFAFVTALLLAYDPAKRLARLKVTLEHAMVNARMIYEILDLPDTQRDVDNAVALNVTDGEIIFDNVCFDYGDNIPVLNGLSFTAKSHETTALVGPSGAGKSTIISLLQRFYDPISGVITIDGQDIGQVTKSTLRGQIAYVSQQAYLFEGTVRDNIRYGRPDATDDEIIEAAKLANAHQFISTLQFGYDTPVGENGITLSGGQRQRVSIARAIVRNAPILLLDEATSALDNESEKLVQEALDKVMIGRTTIVIAHRLSTVVNADKIVVIDNGQVIETGTHATLVKLEKGMYARFNQLSLGAS